MSKSCSAVCARNAAGDIFAWSRYFWSVDGLPRRYSFLTCLLSRCPSYQQCRAWIRPTLVIYQLTNKYKWRNIGCRFPKIQWKSWHNLIFVRDMNFSNFQVLRQLIPMSRHQTSLAVLQLKKFSAKGQEEIISSKHWVSTDQLCDQIICILFSGNRMSIFAT